MRFVLISNKKLCELSGCSQKRADVIFLIDSSSSIWPPNFRKQLAFVADVIDDLDISTDVMRVGVVTFGDRAQVVLSLNGHMSKQDVRDVITQTSQVRGSTGTHHALAAMLEMLKSEGEVGRATVAILLMDGEADDRAAALAHAQLARENDVTLLAVGVGDAVNADELTSLASRDDLVFVVDDFDRLTSIRENLTNVVCDLAEHLPQGDAPVNDVIRNLNEHTKPTKAAAQVKIDVTSTTEAMTSLDDEQLLAKGDRTRSKLRCK